MTNDNNPSKLEGLNWSERQAKHLKYGKSKNSSQNAVNLKNIFFFTQSLLNNEFRMLNFSFVRLWIPCQKRKKRVLTSLLATLKRNGFLLCSARSEGLSEYVLTNLVKGRGINIRSVCRLQLWNSFSDNGKAAFGRDVDNEMFAFFYSPLNK